MKIKALLIIGVLSLLVSFGFTHKFYVSNTLIELNPRSQLMEVTCKLFTDDFERVLHVNGIKASLANNTDLAAKSVVEDYITQHLKLKIDGVPVQLSFVGFESEADLTYCYFEFMPRQDFTNVFIENTLFFEAIPEQKNLVDVRMNGWQKSAFLTKEKPSELVYR